MIEQPESAPDPNQLSLTDDDEHSVDGLRIPAAIVAPAIPADGRPPRLSRFWFKNFKGFAEFDISLGSFNVLVGANNAGKSTVLQGIDLLFSLLKLHSQGARLEPRGRIAPVTMFPVANLRDLFFRRITRRGQQPVAATLGAEFGDGSSAEFGVKAQFGSLNSTVLSAVGMEGERLAALLSRPAVWVPSAGGIVRDEEYRTPARRDGLITAGRHNEVLRNLLLELRENRADSFELLQGVLADRFNAALGDVTFDRTLDQFVNTEYAAGTDTRHDLYSAGAGFVQIVQLLAFILARDASVLLLDEPDAHLHSSLQRVVVEVLDGIARERDVQVLVATHSKEIINFVDPSRMIFVDSQNGSAAPISDEVTPMTILRSLGTIDNVDAYTLVKNRRCLFVEGPDDETVLGRFAASLGIRVLTGDDRVVTVPVGGADRFEHVEQLDVFEGMLGRTVNSLELRDRDGRTVANRDEIMARATRELYIFERDSIESYLLNPTVIARAINDVGAERSKALDVTAEEIEGLIISLAEDMKDQAVDRASQRYSDDRLKLDGRRPQNVAEQNAAARELIAANWSDLGGRLRVVPGKGLLRAVRREIQDRYGVNFGNERLAESFLADEIPAEIVEALRKVAALQAGT
jgi:ABC-type histidine transport system ATPase subunit